jgi:uncharacterized protein YlxW (UPF0749 family)
MAGSTRQWKGRLGGIHLRCRLMAEGSPPCGSGPVAATGRAAPARLVGRRAVDRPGRRGPVHHHRHHRRRHRPPQLTQLIKDRRDQLAASEERAAALRAQVESQTAAIAGSDGPIAAQRARAGGFRQAAGFTPLAGRGITVELDDAPRQPDGSRPKGASNDDLVVHQGDVQAVVNALWAGGAEAMSIMDVRILSTSAVRCVGNTLLLHGRVYSPPFKIIAIGDPAAMQRALAASEGVQYFRDAVDHFQLGYRETVSNVTVPAYDGSSTLRSAKVPGETGG